jgi:serine/threonine-protein kinase
MKLVEGETLRQRLGRIPWSPSEVPALVSIVLRVSEAAAYAHDRGVVQRDIKPANIMVGSFGEVLLLDWGLSFSVDAPSGLRLHPGEALTFSGSSPGQSASGAGTPGYMAPEQEAGLADKQGPWSDVFALGVLLLEVLTGTPLKRGMLGDSKSPESLTLPDPYLLALVKDALAKDPHERLSNAREFAERLSAWMGQQEARNLANLEALAEARGRVQQERRSRRIVVRLAIGVCAGLLLAVFFGYRALSGEAENRERAQRVVLRALSEAQDLHREVSQSSVPEAGAWERVVFAFEQAKAIAVEHRVDGEPYQLVLASLATAESDLRSATLRAERRKRDHRMEKALQAADEPRVNWASLNTQDEAFRDAFRDYELDPAQLPAQEFVERIKSSALRSQLVRGLMLWGATRFRIEREGGSPSGLTARGIFDLALAAEPTELGKELLSLADHAEGLETISNWSEPQLASLPSAYLVMAADGIGILFGHELAVRFLERCFPYHSGDFFICYQLASWARKGGQPYEAQAVKGLYAALACRPGHPLVSTQLGIHLRRMGEKDRSTEIVKTVLARHPDFTLAWYELLTAFSGLGSPGERPIPYSES